MAWGGFRMKRLGIVVHSAEGGALCFLTACREGQRLAGAHMHPEIVLSAIPMGPALPAWEAGDHQAVFHVLSRGIGQVRDAGADFFICPDNTAHIVLEKHAATFPLPGLHIADVVCSEMLKNGWTTAGLLGTRWTMTGPVYAGALRRRGLRHVIPDESTMSLIHAAIFDELCQGRFMDPTIDLFIQAIGDLKTRGADCVILGCTEIPLIISASNSPLPVLDSTRLLAGHAVAEALSDRPLSVEGGWVRRNECTVNG
jgi:aspartate racemase